MNISFKKLLFVLSVTITACQPREKLPDVSGLQQAVEIVPFEELFNKNLQPFKDSVSTLKEKVIGFDCYYNYVMGFGRDLNMGATMYYKFRNDTNILKLYDTVKQHYPTMKRYESELSQAFAYHRYYLPTFIVPSVYTCISEFGPAASTCDTSIFVSLDMYLHSSYPYYSNFEFPLYMQQRFREEYITPNAIKAWVKNIVPDSMGRRLLDLMVAEGKVLYITKKLLPTTADTLIQPFTAQQLSWLNDNEGSCWSFFIEQNLLYLTAFMETRKYVTDAPTTPGMPRESPGNVGSWLGYKIVKQFMDNSPEVTLTQLLYLVDGQTMLAQAKYKPK